MTIEPCHHQQQQQQQNQQRRLPKASPAAEYLLRHVFVRKGSRAAEFVPLLRRYAREGRSFRNFAFEEEDVIEAFKLFETMQDSAPARATEMPRRQPSSGELLAHANSSVRLGDAGEEDEQAAANQPALETSSNTQESLPQQGASTAAQCESSAATKEKLNLKLLGTQSMCVRADPPRLKRTREAQAAAAAAEAGKEGQAGSHEAELPPAKRCRFDPGGIEVEQLPAGAPIPKQTLRISAGRAAAAAGIHPFCDMGELFLELVYQDLPDLLLRDAEMAGVEVVSTMEERVRLMEKSGEAEALQAALQASASATWLEGARQGQSAIASSIEAARNAGRLSNEEAEELRRVLDLEVNLDFGERHEDAAVRKYEELTGSAVYGQQRRICLRFPEAGPAEALASAIPPLRQEPISAEPEPKKQDESTALPQESLHADEKGSGKADADVAVEGAERERESGDAYFLLTGYVDGLADVSVGEVISSCVPAAAGGQPQEEVANKRSVVVEVKHRMNKIKDPPNIYDICQLCSYCRALGLSEGHLVQCLREEPNQSEVAAGADGAGRGVGRLDIKRIDFSEGTHDRVGWDKHVLPGLYNMAAAVYAVRADEALRMRLLKAANPDERNAFVAELCPHLGG